VSSVEESAKSSSTSIQGSKVDFQKTIDGDRYTFKVFEDRSVIEAAFKLRAAVQAKQTYLFHAGGVTAEQEY